MIYIIDKCPREEYFDKYGEHFNEALCKFAINQMHHSSTPRVLSKDEVDKILEKALVTLSNNMLWDYVFIANMGYHDYWQSSIPDETHLALYIKDVLEDEDGYEGVALNRWCADMCAKDIEIDWESML